MQLLQTAEMVAIALAVSGCTSLYVYVEFGLACCPGAAQRLVADVEMSSDNGSARRRQFLMR